MPFPAGGGAATWLNSVVQYVSPTGSDANNGTSWPTAKRTVNGTNGALAYLTTKGGGELHYADGAVGEIWLRGDGLDIPGWFPQMPLRVVGHGKLHSQFGDPCASLSGGVREGGGRLTPLLWLSKCTASPIVFENVSPPNGVCNQTFRAWDYKRYADGSIALANVTSWVRAAGAATLTVQLPTALAMTTAQRLSNVTYVTFPRQTPLPQPVSVGQWVKIAFTSGSFSSGDYQVTSIDSAYDPLVPFFTIADPGADTAVINNPGTFQSHGIVVNDLIEFVSAQGTSGETPSCAYRVFAVADATHFSVSDPYGYGPRSPSGTFSNPGQYVLQDRSNWYGSGLYTLNNCQGASSVSAVDRFENGPTIDLGGTSDGRNRFFNCAFTGMAGSVINCADPDRVAWALVDGGGGTGAASMNVVSCRPNSGGVRMYGSSQSTWGFTGSETLGDIGVGDVAPPALAIIRGNSSGFVYCNSYATADAAADVPNITLENMVGADVRTINCGLVTGAGYVEGGIPPGAWAVRTESPGSKQQHGFWQYNKLAGVVAATYRANGGLASARYKSKALDPGSWTLNSSTLTQGLPDPFGGTGASSLTGPHNVVVYTASQAVAVGDKWLFGCWIKRTGGMSAGTLGVITLSSSPAVAGWAAIANVEFKGDGEWQWVVVAANSTGLQASTTVTATISVPDLYTVYSPTVIKIPAADVTTNEFYEMLETFRAQPNYLPAGADGNGSGRKFVAHGGLGTAARYTVGGSAGQITIGAAAAQAIEVFDEAGNSLGVIRPNAFVIN
jgi:hypothetical protein